MPTASLRSRLPLVALAGAGIAWTTPPETLDQLLAGDPAAALAACVEIDATLGAHPRDRSRFLLQYGQALAASGDADAATLAFLRGSLLEPDGRWAPRAMLLAARATLERERPEPALAARLARLARGLADAGDDDRTRSAAEELLRRIPSRPENRSP